MFPRFSIVIPTYNRCNELLIPCLESIIKFTDLSNVEIIIVANGCTDETKDYVNALSSVRPQFKLLWMDDASGYAKPTNEGIKASVGEYIILLNNDTVLINQPKNEWIDKLIHPFLEDDKMGITGPMKTFSPSAGRDFIIFFCVMISRKVIDTIGLLDESFYSYGEDTDFVCRAEDAGFKIKQVPRDSNEYYEDNRMKGDFGIWHIGNVSHKNFPDGDKLIAKNNEMLRERYNKPKQYIGFDDSNLNALTGISGCTGKSGIPNTSRDWTTPINIERALKCDGFMSDEELLWLATNVRDKKIVVEVGSWHGKSSRAIGDNLSHDGVLYCIDTWNGSLNEQSTHHASAKMMDGDHAYYEFLQNNIDLIHQGKIIPLRMSSKNASDFFKEKNIKADMIFIDADHTYDGVRKDIECWLPLVKEGGTICGHDYIKVDYMQVLQAVDSIFPNVNHIAGTSIWSHLVHHKDATSKIYDCFPMNMELDILQKRFEELFSVVDRFVIVESTLTHGGKPKPLYFKENLKRFEKYLHKISHVVVDENEFPAKDSWSIERFQRNSIMRALTNCNDIDTIIISDLDEIPNADAVKNYNVNDGIKSFEMHLYYYNMNCRAKDKWTEAKILPYSLLKTLTPCGARYTKADIIHNAGKHLSYFGGVESIKKKIEDTAHQEYNKEEFKSAYHIEQAIRDGKDLFNRNLEFEKINE